MNDHLFGKELFIRFTASAFRKLLSVYVFSYFPFGFEGRIWDLIVSLFIFLLWIIKSTLSIFRPRSVADFLWKFDNGKISQHKSNYFPF